MSYRRIILPFLLLVCAASLLPATASAQCTETDDTRCLRDGRFQLQVSWKDFEANEGMASVVDTAPRESDDSALFYFFDSNNWEMLVKILDGCEMNQRFWVFSAATTNVEFELTVTDTWSDTTKTYSNPLGVSADAVTDTSAFATCDANEPGT
jgi:hypothetical protein